jgi:hypothetical protein
LHHAWQKQTGQYLICCYALILLMAAVQIKIEGGGMVPVGGGPSGRMHLPAAQQVQHAQQHAAQQAAAQQQQVGAGGMMAGYTGMLLPATNGYGEAAPHTSDLAASLP